MIPDKFYGDDARWFIATVVNWKDPEAQGRVQIRIHGVHSPYTDEVPNAALPWADTLMPTTEGGVSGLSKVPQVQNSAIVFGIFLDGKASQAPLVIGSLHKIERPSSTQVQQSITSGQSAKYSSGTSYPGGVVITAQDRTEYSQTNGSIDASRLLVMKFLVRNGFKPIAAAGITGNLEAESNFKPNARSTPPEYSIGIAQWNTAKAAGKRGIRLKDYAAANNENFEDFYLQLRFLLHELAGDKADYYNSNGEHFGTGNLVKKCTTFEGGVSDTNSTWIIISKYEKPKNARGKLAERERYARKAYEQYMSARTSAEPAGPGGNGGV